jgi:hypothetical protein
MGLGRRTFAPGEVLTASNVMNYLQDQAVMNFAGTAARGSAIGTAVSQGMVSYLNDTNALEVYRTSGTAVGWDRIDAPQSPNIIINGAFEINQRAYASASNLASGAYGFDRWKSNYTNTTLTFTSAPQGQLVTINTSGGVEQVIERSNVPAGTYTLSWSGTATGRVYNTGATPPDYAASPITVVLDGSANVEVEFTASGGTRTLGFVQLERGLSATPFRRNGNSLQGELAACQRYFIRLQSTSTVALAYGYQNATGSAQGIIHLPVTMRAAPSGSATNCTFSDDVTFANALSGFGVTTGTDPTAIRFTCSFSAAGAQFRPGHVRGSGTGTIDLTAEL